MNHKPKSRLPGHADDDTLKAESEEEVKKTS